MKMKKLNIYIIGLLTLMLCGIQSCALESEVFDEITPSIYPQTERDVRDLVTGNAYSPFQNYDYGGLYNVANGVMLISDMATEYGFCSWGGWIWEPLEFARWTPSDEDRIAYPWTNYLKGISKINQCQTDWIVYRYADVLTLLAEAIVREGNTVTTEAINLLNQVRTRAGLTAYTASSFSSARDFLDKLLIERAHEFYFEGCRRQDLIRDGSYVATMKQKCTDYGQVSIINENYHRFPIPESAIIAGQGIIKQNPGY